MGDLGDSFRDFREYKNKIRDDKYEKFCSKTLPKLQKCDKVTHIEKTMEKFIITTTNFGIIDVFPKSNRLLVRKNNKWYSGAIHWLIDNLL